MVIQLPPNMFNYWTDT